MVLESRYASQEMVALFSKESKYSNWRKLWLELAKAEKLAGHPILPEAIKEMESNTDSIDFEKVSEYERKFKHEVIAHIHAYSDICPHAKGIIHLGATSSFVMDGSDLILYRDALRIIQGKLKTTLLSLSKRAKDYSNLPCLGYTHFQPAQPTTMGKRFASWAQDLLFSYRDLNDLLSDFPFIGVKGATGTQSSFLKLFDGDQSKVDLVEKEVAKAFGFTSLFPLVSQTYPRIQDGRILAILSRIAVALNKMGTDLRLLSHSKEVQEPLSKHQVGSSAMPHKCNPIRSERLCSLSRQLINLERTALDTAANQWLERSLDDSASRRLTMPQAFLLCDSLLHLAHHLSESIEVDEEQVGFELDMNLPFLKLEPILMECCKQGCDREKVHTELLNAAKKGYTSTRRGEKINLVSFVDPNSINGLDLSKIEASITINQLIGNAPLQVMQFSSDLEETLKQDRVKEIEIESVKI
ncbi:MAG: adenylosuccinate lyase [Rhabdochlamydiaceae bacterium]|nr:adenylosuccinate lyase [Candidatus Amphrikana amoebophyrae]